MLSENQIKRLLGQCTKVDEAYGTEIPPNLQAEFHTNQGWTQALRLVLEEDTAPIRNDWFYAGRPHELIQKLEELVEDGKIEMVVDDEGKLFYRAKEIK